VSSKNGSMAESMRDESDDDSGSAAKLISIHAVIRHRFWGEDYEPWLFQTMLNELSERELGVGFIYSILELFATDTHSLTWRRLVNESFGTQMFRLGGEAVTPEMRRTSTRRRVSTANPTPCPRECDAVRTACQLRCPALARFSAAHDPLTNIANRRSFDEPSKFRRAQRSLRLGVHAGPSGSE